MCVCVAPSFAQKVAVFNTMLAFNIHAVTVLPSPPEHDAGVCSFWQGDQRQKFCHMLQDLQAVHIIC